MTRVRCAPGIKISGTTAINVNFETLCNVGIVNFETDTKKARVACSTIEWGAVGRNVQLSTRVYFWGCAPLQRTNPHSFFVFGVRVTHRIETKKRDEKRKNTTKTIFRGIRDRWAKDRESMENSTESLLVVDEFSISFYPRMPEFENFKDLAKNSPDSRSILDRWKSISHGLGKTTVSRSNGALNLRRASPVSLFEKLRGNQIRT